jgi:TPR repeat protein
VIWFRKAAEQGHAAAQSNLGVMYETGSGVPKSATQAASYFVLGLQGGNAFILNRAPSEWDTETAREMQRRLSALVFYDGAIDGKIGPQSIAAMRRLLP